MGGDESQVFGGSGPLYDVLGQCGATLGPYPGHDRQEQEADGGDRPEGAVDLGDCACHPEEQRAERDQQQRVDRVLGESSAGVLRHGVKRITRRRGRTTYSALAA